MPICPPPPQTAAACREKGLLWLLRGKSGGPLRFGPTALLLVLLCLPVAAQANDGEAAAGGVKESQAAAPLAEAAAEPPAEPNDLWGRADNGEYRGGEPFSPGLTMFKAFGVLALLIGLMLFVAALLKRMGLGQGGFGGSGELIKIIETRSVGPKKYIAVAEVAGEYLLLGIGEGQINLIARLKNGELIRRSQTAAPGAGAGGGFAGLLAGAMKQHRQAKD